MKKLITSLIMATALVNIGAYSQDKILPADVLGYSKIQDANNLEFTVIGEASQSLQKEDEFSPVSLANRPSDWSSQFTTYAWTAVKWGVAATVVGATLFYGNAAIFWGTYYTAYHVMTWANFGTFNSFVGATNAAIVVVNSSLAKGALSATAGLITHCTAEAGKFGLKTTATIAKGLWSWGTSYFKGMSQSSSIIQQAAPAA
ncbi:MAG: hypothetical protein K0M45_04670 [Candidatus Paracaedibacteraceae bacterium]|nr:hypothetical protein [Candidatus Paracaedibacteraceae bacterium]